MTWSGKAGAPASPRARVAQILRKAVLVLMALVMIHDTCLERKIGSDRPRRRAP
jgi:hypothetical protein